MSTVIKAGQAGAMLKRLSTVDLADHLAEARTVIDKAQRRAAKLIAAAKVQAERVLEETGKSGYDAGYEKATQIARQRGVGTEQRRGTRTHEVSRPPPNVLPCRTGLRER